MAPIYYRVLVDDWWRVLLDIYPCSVVQRCDNGTVRRIRKLCKKRRTRSNGDAESETKKKAAGKEIG